MREKRKNKSYKKRKNTSIFFMLWTVFSLFCLVLIVLSAFLQGYHLRESYRQIIFKDISHCGTEVKSQLRALQEEEDADYDYFFQKQSFDYDTSIFFLDEEGKILYPERLSSNTDFSIALQEAKEQIHSARGTAIFDWNGVCIYASPFKIEGEQGFLYVSKSLAVSQGVTREATLRMVILSVCLMVISFVLTGLIAGWLTKPLGEMTSKAERLASGDYSVDFKHGLYGTELMALAEMLNRAKDELGKSDQMQRELIANVSHDFKTPLTMIKAYASMIQEISGENREKRERHAQIIIDEADRLSSLVSDVLDISKIRSSLDSLSPQVFDLSAYLKEVLGKFAYLSETKGYVFETDIQEGLFTRADKEKIGQVLYNLIGNAVNYTGEDKFVKIGLTQSANGLVLTVRDTGAGIDEEEIDTIWDRYYRSKEMHKRPVQGTGLGLSIVKAILEKHKFRFGAQSRKGKGSIFYVIFPVWEN